MRHAGLPWAEIFGSLLWTVRCPPRRAWQRRRSPLRGRAGRQCHPTACAVAASRHYRRAPLADGVKKWGEWIGREAEKELGRFYPADPDGAPPLRGSGHPAQGVRQLAGQVPPLTPRLRARARDRAARAAITPTRAAARAAAPAARATGVVATRHLRSGWAHFLFSSPPGLAGPAAHETLVIYYRNAPCALVSS